MLKCTVNKNQFNFIYWLHRACSLYVFTMISMNTTAAPILFKLLFQVECVDPPELRDGQGVADPKDRLLLLVKNYFAASKRDRLALSNGFSGLPRRF